ncbi:MAG: YfhO family protein [Solobacterium sp.]|nr:YfhO family protein [Solobacterium sp.]
MKQRRNRIALEYGLTVLGITALYLFACAVQRITPFGDAVLMNFTDFKSQSVPIYMHLWDAIHGNGSLFFDWRIGLGSSFLGTISHYSLLSPLNLFFFFVRRETIPSAMTWFILLKLLALGLSMCAFLRNDRLLFGKKRCASLWVIIGSISYAVNGYTVQYYGFPWMDTAAVVPLCMLFLNRMLTSKETLCGKNELGYVVFLTLIFLINIPQAFAVCLFLIGYVCGVIFLLFKEPEQKKTASMKIILYSIIGLGCSMILFYPAMKNINHSYRMTYGNYGNGLQSYIVKMDLARQETERKYMMAIGIAVPLLVSLGYSFKALRTQGHRSEALFMLYLLLLVLLPIPFESVNGIYHNGPYSCYPMRYGFLLSFVGIVLGIRALRDLNRVFLSRLLALLWAGEMCVLLSHYLEPSQPYDYPSLGEELTAIAGNETGLSHTKIMDASLLENYPLYVNQEALSNYVPLNSKRQVTYAQRMGYTQDWVALYDQGGTLFSDAVMLEKTLLYPGGETDSYMDALIEQGLLARETDSVLTWKLSYPNAFYLEDADLGSIHEELDLNPFVNQDRLAELLFHTDLFHTEQYDLSTGEVVIPVEEETMLYFWSADAEAVRLYVNGTLIDIPIYQDRHHTSYPETTNNGIVTLGLFQQESVTITLENLKETEGTFYLSSFDLNAWKETLEQADITITSWNRSDRSLSFQIESESDGAVMIPIYADEGWKASVNGKSVEWDTLYGMFLVVPVIEGNSAIELTFVPEGLYVGAIISLISLLCLAIFYHLGKNRALPAKVGTAAEWTIKVVWVSYLLYVYVIPVLFRLGMSAYKRFF